MIRKIFLVAEQASVCFFICEMNIFANLQKFIVERNLQPLENRGAMTQTCISSTFYSTTCKKQFPQSYVLSPQQLFPIISQHSLQNLQNTERTEEQISFEHSFYLCCQFFIFFPLFSRTTKRGMRIPGLEEKRLGGKRQTAYYHPLCYRT